jgi:hypothetical protein
LLPAPCFREKSLTLQLSTFATLSSSKQTFANAIGTSVEGNSRHARCGFVFLVRGLGLLADDREWRGTVQSD